MFPTGEGAVSTGPLVAVHQPRSEADAAAVIRLLEAHHIPALSSRGLASGWSFDAAGGPILVPAALRGSALEVLRARPRDPDRPAAGASPPASMGAAPSPAVERPPESGGAFDPGGSADVDEAVWSAPIERPEAPHESRRWWVALALLAVATGLLLQVGVDAWLGRRAAIELFGAQADAWPELHRWVTAGFIHGSGAHATGNALFGLLIGWAAFQTHGVGAAAFVWLASSVVGMVAQTSLHPEAMVIGASAGNYGLVGLWARGQWERASRRALPRREVLRTVGVLALLIPGAFTPFTSDGRPIAVAAHALGFCGGALAGLVFPRRLAPEATAATDRRSDAAGWMAVGVAALSFALALGRAGWP